MDDELARGVRHPAPKRKFRTAFANTVRNPGTYNLLNRYAMVQNEARSAVKLTTLPVVADLSSLYAFAAAAKIRSTSFPNRAAMV